MKETVVTSHFYIHFQSQTEIDYYHTHLLRHDLVLVFDKHLYGLVHVEADESQHFVLQEEGGGSTRFSEENFLFRTQESASKENTQSHTSHITHHM